MFYYYFLIVFTFTILRSFLYNIFSHPLNASLFTYRITFTFTLFRSSMHNLSFFSIYLFICFTFIFALCLLSLSHSSVHSCITYFFSLYLFLCFTFIFSQRLLSLSLSSVHSFFFSPFSFFFSISFSFSYGLYFLFHSLSSFLSFFRHYSHSFFTLPLLAQLAFYDTRQFYHKRHRCLIINMYAPAHRHPLPI